MSDDPSAGEDAWLAQRRLLEEAYRAQSTLLRALAAESRAAMGRLEIADRQHDALRQASDRTHAQTQASITAFECQILDAEDQIAKILRDDADAQSTRDTIGSDIVELQIRLMQEKAQIDDAHAAMDLRKEKALEDHASELDRNEVQRTREFARLDAQGNRDGQTVERLQAHVELQREWLDSRSFEAGRHSGRPSGLIGHPETPFLFRQLNADLGHWKVQVAAFDKHVEEALAARKYLPQAILMVSVSLAVTAATIWCVRYFPVWMDKYSFVAIILGAWIPIGHEFWERITRYRGWREHTSLAHDIGESLNAAVEKWRETLSHLKIRADQDFRTGRQRIDETFDRLALQLTESRDTLCRRHEAEYESSKKDSVEAIAQIEKELARLRGSKNALEEKSEVRSRLLAENAERLAISRGMAAKLRDKVRADDIVTARLLSEALANKASVEIRNREVHADMIESARLSLSQLRSRLETVRQLGKTRSFADSGSVTRDFDGAIRVASAEALIRLPDEVLTLGLDVAIPLQDAIPLVIRFEEDTREKAVVLVEQICLRLCAELHRAEVAFTIFDPRFLGHSAKTLSGFLRSEPSVLHGGMSINSEQLNDRLDLLLHRITDIIQTKLGDEFTTFEQYNALASGDPITYEVVIIYDFQEELDTRAMEKLARVVQMGPRCGVFCIFTTSGRAALTAPEDELFKAAFIVDLGDGRVFLPGWNFPDLSLQLEAKWPIELSRTIVRNFGVSWQRAREAHILATEISDGEVWKGNSSRRIVASLGRSDARHELDLELNSEDESHALVIGSTGKGKSILLHDIICNLCIRYSPEELELLLVDFKRVEFQIYADESLPHAIVIATNSSAEFGLSVLEDLLEELSNRQRLFQDARVAKFSDYRERSVSRLARRVFIADEFQELFSDPRRAERSAQILQRIAREGRAFGLHLILSTQTLRGIPVNLPFLDQIRNRIAFQVSERDFLHVAGGNDSQDLALALRSLNQLGEAIFFNTSGSARKFRSFYRSTSAVRKDVQRITGRLGQVHVKPLTQRIFDGRRSPSICSTLAFTDTRTFPSPGDDKLKVVVGESMRLSPAEFVQLGRRPGDNVLLIGEDEKVASSVLLAMAMSLAAHASRIASCQDIRCTLLDFTGQARQKVESLLVHLSRTAFAADLPILVPNVERCEEVLRMWADEVQTRNARNRTENARAFIFLVGLDMSPMANDGGIRQSIREILENGPQLGIHLILWASSSDGALVSVKSVFQEIIFLQADVSTQYDWGLARVQTQPGANLHYCVRERLAQGFQAFAEATPADIRCCWDALV